jgi:hypothetical protein
MQASQAVDSSRQHKAVCFTAIPSTAPLLLKHTFLMLINSRDNERVEGTQGILLGTLEPTFVSNLALEDVEVTVGANSGLDDLMAAALIAICGADKDLVSVVVPAFFVLLLRVVQQGRGCIAALCEATLGLGGACSRFPVIS